MVILCYHRVTGPRSFRALDRDNEIPVSRFEKQLLELKKRFLLPSLDEPFDFEKLLRGEGERTMVLLTFDDGYREMHELVLPLLVRHRVRAVFFLSTLVLDQKHMLWYQRLEQALLKTRKRFVSYRQSYFSLKTSEKRQSAYFQLRAKFDAWARNSVEKESEKIVKSLGVRETSLFTPLYLGWKDAKELRDKGMVVGFHGHRHIPLEDLSPRSRRNDFERGTSLMKLRGLEPSLFAYPFGGKKGIGPWAKAELRRKGLRYAFTTCQGEATHQSDPFVLPRIVVHPGYSLQQLLGLIRLARLGRLNAEN